LFVRTESKEVVVLVGFAAALVAEVDTLLPTPQLLVEGVFVLRQWETLRLLQVHLRQLLLTALVDVEFTWEISLGRWHGRILKITCAVLARSSLLRL